jgi:1-deoxy-D-xylulose-5-phosphate synthase
MMFLLLVMLALLYQLLWGWEIARNLTKSDNHIVAGIGDGSLGTGIAFEAINHAGHEGTKMILILNDNGMSISPTPGAMSKLLNQVRTDYRLELAKNRLKKPLIVYPWVTRLLRMGKKAKNRFERVILPNAFWEKWGFVSGTAGWS